MTSNEHYGQLNSRFDARAEYLRSKGYAYKFFDVFGTSAAAFVRNASFSSKPPVVLACYVMNADDRTWADKIVEVERL